MSKVSKLGPNGKDVVIFATPDDHKIPSTITLPEVEPSPGLILSNGEINWNCPCLGGMATGPCGVQFRDAFSCFHYSDAEPKGSDCYNRFKSMQECMEKFPTLYKKDLGDDEKIAEALEHSEKKLEESYRKSVDELDKQSENSGLSVKESDKPAEGSEKKLAERSEKELNKPVKGSQNRNETPLLKKL